MTYRGSLLSLYPPTLNSLKGKQETDLSFEEELPATAPVFEGHLYLRTDKKQWQWRLFRFDGTSFTCLSTRKVKLPPNTHVDAPLNDLHLLHSLPSFTSTSLTSPLLATPKNKSRQTSTTTSAPPLANYYQLPKWAIDIVNISAVSVLKPSKKKKQLISSQKHARCFCVRTFDGECYIMKAQKQKDLERWLFVLTKMWKFTQAMKHQLLSQQPQHQQIIRQQQQYHHQPYHSTLSSPTKSPSQLQQQQQQQQLQDTIPLSRMYQRPHHTSLKNINNNATQSPMVTTTTFSQLPSSAMHNQPPSPVGAAVTTKSTSVYEKKYQHPSLSAEKVECIDAWRQSLSELMASDPQLRLSSPPPIESIPDDDQISVISDMTSISHRQPHLRRRISIASSSSKRSIRSNKVKPRDQQKVSPQLKKKRSNDVKNWIEPRKMDSHGNIIGSSPIGLPPIDTYQVAYFQDCKTTARSSSSGSLHLDHDDTQQKEVQNKNTTTVMLDRHAKYHNSTRAKQIQIVDVQHSPITPQQQSIDITTTSSSCRPRSNSSAQQSKFVSPSDNFPPTRRSLDNNNNNSNTDSTIRSPPTSMLAESPLYSLAHVDSKNQDEEEISLADLQRSLKRASLQHHQQRTVSSSSLPASTQNQQYNHRHSYTHHHPQHQPYHSSVSVAAPAVPPVPYNNHLGMISRASILSGTTPQYAEPELDQQEEKWKKQQRSRSWMPSCEQQKIIQQRRSFQLDTTHW